MLPTSRRPTTPGEILREDFLVPSGLTQSELAKRLGMSLQRLNGILRGHRAVTAETALLLSREFKTSPQLWMNLQDSVDLWDAAKRMRMMGALRHYSSAARSTRARASTKRGTAPRSER
ncbi:MAG TPA: HigA family addiction module antitoxin [Myxococcales bacterium]|jgi:addiction module HigA family antidote